MAENNKTESCSTNNMSDSGVRVAKNTAILVTLRIVIPLLSVGLMLVLSRKLGVEGVGRYSLVFSILYLFNTLGPLGLYQVITREGARDKSILEEMLANALTLGTVTSIVLTGLMIVLGNILGYDTETRLSLAVLSVAILPYTIATFLEGACVALERTKYIAASTLSEYVIKVGAGIALLYLGYGLQAVLIMAVAGRILACLVSARLLRRAHVRMRWALDRNMIRKLIKLAPTFVLIAVFATLYWRIDILMLSILQPMEDVGYYGASYQLFQFTMVIPASVCLALFPLISTLVHKDPNELLRLSTTVLRYLLALTLPIAVSVSLLGEHVLAFLYGEPFREAALTLTVLIWTLVPYALVRYHAYVFVAANLQRVDLWLNIGMSIVNILLNLVLIPWYGHLGAAYATFGSICIYGIFQYVYMKRILPDQVAHFSLPPVVILAAGLTGFSIWLLLDLSVPLAIASAMLVYTSILIIGGFFSNSELALLGIDRILNRIGLFGGLSR